MLKHAFRLTVSEDAGSGRNTSTELNPMAPVFAPRSRIPRGLRPIAPIFVPRWQMPTFVKILAPVFARRSQMRPRVIAMTPVFTPSSQVPPGINHLAPVFIPVPSDSQNRSGIDKASNRIDSNHTLAHTLA